MYTTAVYAHVNRVMQQVTCVHLKQQKP